MLFVCACPFVFRSLLVEFSYSKRRELSRVGIGTRGVIDMVHIDISITLLKQYSLLSLVNTHINVPKYQ